METCSPGKGVPPIPPTINLYFHLSLFVIFSHLTGRGNADSQHELCNIPRNRRVSLCVSWCDLTAACRSYQLGFTSLSFLLTRLHAFPSLCRTYFTHFSHGCLFLCVELCLGRWCVPYVDTVTGAVMKRLLDTDQSLIPRCRTAEWVVRPSAPITPACISMLKEQSVHFCLHVCVCCGKAIYIICSHIPLGRKSVTKCPQLGVNELEQVCTASEQKREPPKLCMWTPHPLFISASFAFKTEPSPLSRPSVPPPREPASRLPGSTVLVPILWLPLLHCPVGADVQSEFDSAALTEGFFFPSCRPGSPCCRCCLVLFYLLIFLPTMKRDLCSWWSPRASPIMLCPMYMHPV